MGGSGREDTAKIDKTIERFIMERKQANVEIEAKIETEQELW